MNGSKAKMLRSLAKMIYDSMPTEPKRQIYQNLKKAYKTKTGPFTPGVVR